MAKLQDKLLNPDKRPKLVNDCVELIDTEVQQRSGISGLAIKGAYKIVNKIKPGIIRSAVEHLIDEFVASLSPFYDSCLEANRKDFAAYLMERRPEVASALLSVTDDRIGGAKNATVRKAYGKLRPMGQKQVETAVPGIARVMSGCL